MGFIKQKFRSIAFSIIFLVLLFPILSPISCFAKENIDIEQLCQIGDAFSQIAANTSPAVVGVKVESKIRSYPAIKGFEDSNELLEYFRRKFPGVQLPKQEYEQVAQATGFIISEDGYILTNSHLIGEAQTVTVKIGNKPDMQAKVIGTDPPSDIAVIKVDANEPLPVLPLGDSDKLKVGQWVLAIGNPFKLRHTVTVGIISALGRTGLGLTTYEDFIQTDAAINPGNSGGPLVNVDGEAIGINTAIVGSTGSIGIGMAIPINMAKSVYEQIVKNGKVVRGYLGVSIQDLTPELALTFNVKENKGVIISDVVKGSPAEKKGIMRGDIIVEFNGQTSDTANELQNKIGMLKPGTNINVILFHNGQQKNVNVELGERPKEVRVVTEVQPQSAEKLGIGIQNLTDDLMARFGYQSETGVIVSKVEPESPAAIAGITKGSLIMEVNNSKVKNINDFHQALQNALKEKKLLLLINSQGSNRYVVINLPK